MSASEERPKEWEKWLGSYAVDYAAEHSMLVKTRDFQHWSPVGFTLLPRKISKECFRQMMSLAEPFNLLVDRVSRDHSWLFQTLEKAAEVDDFTKNLLSIGKRVSKEGVTQPISLGIHRSDYMLHCDPSTKEERPLQVELNTIAASFGCLTTKLCNWHRHVRERFSQGFEEVNDHFRSGNMEENNVAKEIAAGFAAARNAYGSSREETAILFVVQTTERNLMDQRILEHELYAGYSIPCVRYSLKELHRVATYEGGRLFVPGNGGSDRHYEVSVIYYRAGYSPDDYEDASCWEVRYQLELSLAIKCPNIFYQLVGAKKVQQALSRKETLGKFMEESHILPMMDSFAGLWGLGENEQDSSTKTAVENAIDNPHSYVLKPQREGGGNNLWGEEISKALKNYSSSELAAYILMERIRPRAENISMLRDSVVQNASAISEVGIFGIFLAGDSGVMLNHQGGHLIRTKGEAVDEGGVNTGFAVLDSALLY